MNWFQCELIGLLQQIVEDTSADGIERTSHSQCSSSGETGCSAAVVGPTAAELESLKELIQFDHEYYKSEPPTMNVSQYNDKPQSNLSQVTTSGTAKMTESKCVTSSKVPSATESNSENAANVASFQNSTNTVMPSESELEKYLERNFESLVDLNALLEESQVGGLDQVASVSSEDKTIHMNSESVLVTGRSVKEVNERLNLQPEVISFSDDLTSVIPYSPLQSLVDDEASLKTSISDSAYSSDLSDVNSPKSDTSLFEESDILWEESFTELFPSLA